MTKRALCMLALLLVAAMLMAKEQPISAVVNNATYVLVTTPSGDVFNPNVTPEDRKAVQDVQSAIEKWGRYKLVYKPGEADLILVVRTGRTLEVHGGAQVGSTTGPHGSGQSLGAENGDPQDTLEVYLSSQASGSPLWRGRAVHGLNPPDMKLVKDFRAKVEAAAKKK